MPSSIAQNHSFPLELVGGKGSYLIDTKGKKYLDFLGGWCTATVGWGNTEMAAAISRQAKRGFYVSPIFRNPAQDKFAKQLTELAPGKITRAYRCTSGSEAVEYAIQCARAATGKSAIITIADCYHGRTYGAASLGNSCDQKIGPCLPGFIKLPLPKTEADAKKVLKQCESMMKGKDIAAFMSEPIWTNAGCFIPPKGFYEGIQKLCKKYKVLLAMDEVATGMGRSGRMFASELWDLEPDIICLGKSITGGYATMAATLVTEKVFKACRKIEDYSTFGWLPQDLAATEKNVEIIVRDNLTENSRNIGGYILEELKGLEKLRKVKEVRGIGMIFSIEFTLPISPLVMYKCYRNKMLVAFTDSKTLFFSPPLSLSKKDADQGIKILKKVCGA